MSVAKECLDDLMEIMWYRGPLPEEGQAIEVIEWYLALYNNAALRKGLCVDTKAGLREEINVAFSQLLSVCQRLDLQTLCGRLEKQRSFMSQEIDRSDLPSI